MPLPLPLPLPMPPLVPLPVPLPAPLPLPLPVPLPAPLPLPPLVPLPLPLPVPLPLPLPPLVPLPLPLPVPVQGLETPAYSVEASRNTYEIRKYERFSVCQVTGAPASGPSGFQSLAGYILRGQNKAEQQMAMTTPVLMRATGEGERASMAFVLPREYAQAPPPPLDDSGVTLRDDSGGIAESELTAALWFSGLGGQSEGMRRAAVLEQCLADDAEYELVPGKGPFIAAYNDPFTAPWKRRNEVLVPVRRRVAAQVQEVP